MVVLEVGGHQRTHVTEAIKPMNTGGAIYPVGERSQPVAGFLKSSDGPKIFLWTPESFGHHAFDVGLQIAVRHAELPHIGRHGPDEGDLRRRGLKFPSRERSV